MRRRTLSVTLTALLAVVVTTPRSLVSLQPEPWFGTWSLNPAKSGRSNSSPFKRETCRIEPWGDGLKVTYDMVGTRGGVTHMEWTGRFDGKDYIMQGMDSVLTNAYRKIDDRSYEIVIKRDGEVAATARVAVSPDGQTLNVATEGQNASGQIMRTTTVYERK